MCDVIIERVYLHIQFITPALGLGLGLGGGG
jgi:hypothetical protein